MRIIRIYCPYGEYQQGKKVKLDVQATHHLLHVLRFKAGEVFELFNGVGNVCSAQLNTQGKEAWAELLHPLEAIPEPLLKIHLFSSLIKGEKMDWMVQKAVELGVHSITPIITKFTDIKLTKERFEKKQAHWQGVMEHACEQSQRAYIPELRPIIPFKEALAIASSYNKKVLLHPYVPSGNGEIFSPNLDSIALFIGPEGGFESLEVKLAEEAGCHFLCLGKRILRAETAALAAIALFQTQLGDMRL